MLNEVSKWQRNKERLKLQSNYKKKKKKKVKTKKREVLCYRSYVRIEARKTFRR